MTVRSRISLASMAVGLLLLPLSAARAELFTTPAGATNPNTGRPASASADFELSGGNLVITLTNTLVNPSQTTPGDVLTDVDFSINGSGAVTGTGGSVIASAVGNNGVDVTATTGTDVTAGYQFATGVTTTNGPPLTSEFGVSATSYNGSGATATTVTNMAPDTSVGQIFHADRRFELGPGPEPGVYDGLAERWQQLLCVQLRDDHITGDHHVFPQ
jgi:hypothetical protein